MLHALFSKLVDEVMANILLHHFLWSGRRPPERGPASAELPGLYSGCLESFYAPAPRPVSLEAPSRILAESDSASVRDLHFDSETKTRWPHSDIVRCRHWKTRAPDRGLTVVGVDGIVQLGCRWFRRLAAELNPRGIDVLTMDAPFNFRRTPPGRRPGQLIVGGDVAHQLAVTRQGVLDLWRVVVSLQQQGRRVGLVGVSYGGWLTLLTSLLAEDLEFLVAIVPPVNIVRMLQSGGTIVRGLRRGLGHAPLDIEELSRMAGPVVPLRWQPRLPGERISLHAAIYDRLVPCEGIEELALQWGTRLTRHRAAHYALAVSSSIFPQIAGEICGWPCAAHAATAATGRNGATPLDGPDRLRAGSLRGEAEANPERRTVSC